ncbi:MAG: class I SAM-dependent methyltransferase [Thermoplasmata archaeon]
MDRAEWLAERRATVEQDYTRDAPTYDEGYDPRTQLHRQFVSRLIETCPDGGTILDAACGTGPYMRMILDAECEVVGVDQSAGMAERARTKHPGVRVEVMGLQEIAFEGAFEGAMCIDAMEHVPPEEWPKVLANLRTALKAGGHLYLTVEELGDRGELDRIFAEATAAGLPTVHGEDVGDGTGGYHYYPDREQIRRWLANAGFSLVEEADERIDKWGYYHLLVRTPGDR